MKTGKKLLSLVLALVMVVSMLPTTLFASAEEPVAAEVVYNMGATTTKGTMLWIWNNQTNSYGRADADEFYKPFNLMGYSFDRPENWEFFDISDNFLEYAKSSEWESDSNVRIYADGNRVTEGVTDTPVNETSLTYIKGGVGARNIFTQWFANNIKVWHGRENTNVTCQLGENCSVDPKAGHTHNMAYTIREIGIAVLLDAPEVAGEYGVSIDIKNVEYFDGKISAWIAPFEAGEYDMSYYMTDENLLSADLDLPNTNGKPMGNINFGSVTVDPAKQYVFVVKTRANKMTDTYNYYTWWNTRLTPHTHSYDGAWTKVNDEVHGNTCAGCGVQATEAHAWDDGVVTVEPSSMGDGLKVYTCSVCSGTKEEILPYEGGATTVVYDLKSVSNNQKHIWNWEFATHTSPLANISEFAWKPNAREQKADAHWEFFDLSDSMWDVLKAGSWKSNDTFKFTIDGKNVNSARTPVAASASADGETYFSQLGTMHDVLYQFSSTYLIFWGSRGDESTCPDGENCTLIESPAAGHKHKVIGSVVGPHDIALALDAPGAKGYYELVMNTKEDAYNGTRSVWFAPYVEGQNDISYYKTDANLVASGVAKKASNAATNFGTVDVEAGVDKYILVFQCDSNVANGYQKLFIDNFSLVPHEHVYGDTWTDVDDNNHGKVCSCGEGTLEPHAWDEGVVTKQPSRTEEGLKVYTCSVCGATKEEVLPSTVPTVPAAITYAFGGPRNGTLLYNYNYETGGTRIKELFNGTAFQYAYYNVQPANWKFFDTFDEIWGYLKSTEYQSDDVVRQYIDSDTTPVTLGITDTSVTGTTQRYLKYTSEGSRSLIPQWNTSADLETSFLKMWHGRQNSASTCALGVNCPVDQTEGHKHAFKWNVARSGFAIAIDAPAAGEYDISALYTNSEGYNGTVSVWFAEFDGDYDLEHYAVEENLIAEGEKLPSASSKTAKNFGTVEVKDATKPYIIAWQSTATATNDTYDYYNLYNISLTPHEHDADAEWVKVDDETHAKTCSCGVVFETAPHNWNEGVEKTPALPGIAGEMLYTCADCAAEKTEIIPALPSAEVVYSIVARSAGKMIWNWDFATHTSPRADVDDFKCALGSYKGAYDKAVGQNWEFFDMSDDLFAVYKADSWTSDDVITFGIGSAANKLDKVGLTAADGVYPFMGRPHDILFQWSQANMVLWRARYDSQSVACPNDATCALPNFADNGDGTHKHNNAGYSFNGDFSFALALEAPTAADKYDLSMSIGENQDSGSKSVWFAPYVEGEDDMSYYMTEENLVADNYTTAGGKDNVFGTVEVDGETEYYIVVFKINGSTRDTYEKTVFTGFKLTPHEHVYGDTWTDVDDNNHGKVCSCGEGTLEPHAWDEGVVTKQPSRTEEGLKVYTCAVCGATKEEILPSTVPTVPAAITYAFGGPRNGTLLYNYNYETGGTRIKELFDGTAFQYAYYNVQPTGWKFFDTFDEIWEIMRSTELQSNDLIKNFVDNDTTPVTFGITDTSATGTTQRYLKNTGAGIRQLIPQWNTSADLETSFLKMWHGRTDGSGTTCALGESCPINPTAGHKHVHKYSVARSGFAIAIDAPAAGEYDISALYTNSEGYNGTVSVWFAEFDGDYDLEHYAVEENLIAEGEKLPSASSKTAKNFGTVEVKDATKPYIVVWQSTVSAENDTYDYYNLYNISLTPHEHDADAEWVKVDDETHAKTCSCGVVFETAPHNWGEGVEKTPALPGVAGEMLYTCSDCAAEKTEVIPALPSAEVIYNIGGASDGKKIWNWDFATHKSPRADIADFKCNLGAYNGAYEKKAGANWEFFDMSDDLFAVYKADSWTSDDVITFGIGGSGNKLENVALTASEGVYPLMGRPHTILLQWSKANMTLWRARHDTNTMSCPNDATCTLPQLVDNGDGTHKHNNAGYSFNGDYSFALALDAPTAADKYDLSMVLGENNDSGKKSVWFAPYVEGQNDMAYYMTEENLVADNFATVGNTTNTFGVVDVDGTADTYIFVLKINGKCVDAYEKTVFTDVKLTPHTHSYGDTWVEVDADNHGKLCACGEGELEPHAWDEGVVTKQPSRTEEGLKVYTCSVCGGTKEEILPSTLPTVPEKTTYFFGGTGRTNTLLYNYNYQTGGNRIKELFDGVTFQYAYYMNAPTGWKFFGTFDEIWGYLKSTEYQSDDLIKNFIDNDTTPVTLGIGDTSVTGTTQRYLKYAGAGMRELIPQWSLDANDVEKSFLKVWHGRSNSASTCALGVNCPVDQTEGHKHAYKWNASRIGFAIAIDAPAAGEYDVVAKAANPEGYNGKVKAWLAPFAEGEYGVEYYATDDTKFAENVSIPTGTNEVKLGTVEITDATKPYILTWQSTTTATNDTYDYYQLYNVSLVPHEHDADAEWVKVDDETHAKTCSCGVVFETAPHNWNEGVEKTPALPGIAGEMLYTCADCAAEKTEIIPALPSAEVVYSIVARSAGKMIWNWDFATHTSPRADVDDFKCALGSYKGAYDKAVGQNWEFFDMSDDLFAVYKADSWTSDDVITFGIGSATNKLDKVGLTAADGVYPLMGRPHDILFQWSQANMVLWRARYDSQSVACQNDATCTLPQLVDNGDGTHKHNNAGYSFNGDFSFALALEAPTAADKYDLSMSIAENQDSGSKSVWFAPYVEGEDDMSYYMTEENLVTDNYTTAGGKDNVFGTVEVDGETDYYIVVFKINGSTRDTYEKTVFTGFKLTPHKHAYSDTWTDFDDEVHGKLCACGEGEREPHAYDEGVVTKQPSRTEEGLKVYTCSVCGGTKEEVLPSTLPTVPAAITYAFGGPRNGTLLYNYNYETGGTRIKELFDGTAFQYAYYNVQPTGWKFFDTFDEIWEIMRSTELQSNDLIKNFVDADTTPVTLGITDTSATGTTQRYLKHTGPGVRQLIPQWNTSADLETSFLKMWHGRTDGSGTTCALGESCPINPTAGHKHVHKYSVARSGFAIAIDAPAAGEYDISALYTNSEGYNGTVSVWFAEFDGDYDLEHYAVEENLIAEGEKLPSASSKTAKNFGTVEVKDATKPYIVVWQSTVSAENDTYDYYNLYNISLTPHEHTEGEWVKVDDETHAKTCSCGQVTATAPHNWGEGVEKTPALPGIAGEMLYTCADCAAERTEIIPALPSAEVVYSIAARSAGKMIWNWDFATHTSPRADVDDFKCALGSYKGAYDKAVGQNWEFFDMSDDLFAVYKADSWTSDDVITFGIGSAANKLDKVGLTAADGVYPLMGRPHDILFQWSQANMVLWRARYDSVSVACPNDATCALPNLVDNGDGTHKHSNAGYSFNGDFSFALALEAPTAADKYDLSMVIGENGDTGSKSVWFAPYVEGQNDMAYYMTEENLVADNYVTTGNKDNVFGTVEVDGETDYYIVVFKINGSTRDTYEKTVFTGFKLTPHEHAYGAWERVDDVSHSKACHCGGSVITEEHTWVEAEDGSKYCEKCDAARAEYVVYDLKDDGVTLKAGTKTKSLWNWDKVTDKSGVENLPAWAAGDVTVNKRNWKFFDMDERFWDILTVGDNELTMAPKYDEDGNVIYASVLVSDVDAGEVISYQATGSYIRANNLHLRLLPLTNKGLGWRGHYYYGFDVVDFPGYTNTILYSWAKDAWMALKLDTSALVSGTYTLDVTKTSGAFAMEAWVVPFDAENLDVESYLTDEYKVFDSMTMNGAGTYVSNTFNFDDANDEYLLVWRNDPEINNKNSQPEFSEFAIRAAGHHEFGEPVIVEPTHLTTGTKTYTCVVDGCSAIRVETLEKLPEHTFSGWYEHDEEVHARECECHEVEFEPHAWDEGVIIKRPTYDAVGTEKFVCSVCGAVKNEIIPILGDKATITVSSATAKAGKTVDVDIVLDNNPGIVSMILHVDYDSEYLTLVNVANGEIFEDAQHSDNLMMDPYQLSWAADLATENITTNGKLATLTFKVANNAPAGELPISVSYDNANDEIYDKDFILIECVLGDGIVTVTRPIVGDVNSDGRISAFDRTILARYVAQWDGYDETKVDVVAADVNADGAVNSFDRTVLARHIAKWSGYLTLPKVAD